MEDQQPLLEESFGNDEDSLWYGYRDHISTSRVDGILHTGKPLPDVLL